ncbi:MAG: SpoIID/LytB domain-containing protein [Solirubrobacteraceae bacterium]
MRSLTPPPYPTLSIRPRAAIAALVVLLGLVTICASARAASTLYIRGGGWGHGVGLSQYGAEGYALHGFDYQQILAHYYTGTSLGKVNPARTVRVLLAVGPASFTGATTVAGSPGTRLQTSQTYEVTPAGRGALTLVSGSGGRIGTFPAPLQVSGPAPLTVPGAGTYRGTLAFYPSGRAVQTVDDVTLDDYVRGVVPAEMPSSWASAALEAQAVAARTYALTGTVAGAHYDLYSDTRSQAYGGVAAETFATDAAVAATSGQVVTYGGRPAVTYFFSSSGGYTESVQDAWPGASPEPWLQAVPDPYDGVAGNPYHRWAKRLSLRSATRRLGSLVSGGLVGIQAIHDGRSPRVVSGQVVGTGGTQTVTGAQLQSAFGLESTYASFTTITTSDPRGRLSGTIFPAPPASRRSAVAVQSRIGRTWHTVSHVWLSATGAYRTTVPAGRWRIAYGSLCGPAVTVR